MIKNTVDSRIRERIEGFVQELDKLVRKSALEALAGVLAGASTGTGARGRRGLRAARAPAAGGGDLAEKVLSHVKANDGQSVSQIGVALGASSKDLRKAMLALQKDGKIHTSGQRRGTRYHAGAGGRKRGGRGRRKA
jgi:biotin operon repressor